MSKAIVILSVMFGTLLLGAVQTAANPIPVWPPEGDINPYADAEGTSRIIVNPEGVVRIYFILRYIPGLSTVACDFSAPRPSCFDAEFLGEEYYFDTYFGNTQTGLAIAFGSCLGWEDLPVLLAKRTYSIGEGYSGATGCCLWWVRPDPSAPSGEIEFVNCNDEKIFGVGGALAFNCTSPVESRTWGKVKSLYAQ